MVGIRCNSRTSPTFFTSLSPFKKPTHLVQGLVVYLSLVSMVLARLLRITPHLKAASFSTTCSVDKLNVGIVGGGPSGLCAGRHILSQPDMDCVIFERTNSLGGTWVYRDETGDFLSPMYTRLVTNFPKECMAFPDFNYTTPQSYITSDLVLKYVQDYADHFKVPSKIKLNHEAVQVAPEGCKWNISVRNLESMETTTHSFDAVAICIGPFHIPSTPPLKGMETFTGTQLHSKDYRKPDEFAGKRVLVVGTGPSGLDISKQLSEVAPKVYLSYNRVEYKGSRFPSNVTIKPAPQQVEGSKFTFKDGTTEEVDVIIFSTGYDRSFPFLSQDCGITVDKYVRPLYKHTINIEHPTMSFIGIPTHIPFMLLIDYQARFFLRTLTGDIVLPSKEGMMSDLLADIEGRKLDKMRERDYHRLWKDRGEKFFAELSQMGHFDNVPPVLLKMFTFAALKALKDFHNFRKGVYKIIDDETYELIE